MRGRRQRQSDWGARRHRGSEKEREREREGESGREGVKIVCIQHRTNTSRRHRQRLFSFFSSVSFRCMLFHCLLFSQQHFVENTQSLQEVYYHSNTVYTACVYLYTDFRRSFIRVHVVHNFTEHSNTGRIRQTINFVHVALKMQMVMCSKCSWLCVWVCWLRTSICARKDWRTWDLLV